MTEESDTPNEILAAVKEAKTHRKAARTDEPYREKNWNLGKIGVQMGIGSAAVAAAVLFANRPRTRK